MPAQMQATIVVSANQLRALAEAVDGLRNTAGVIVADPDDPARPYKVMKKGTELSDRTVVIEVRTDDKPTVTKRDHALTIATDPAVVLATTGEPLEKCDAIFTSLSAIDKFVVPYYARMRPLADVEQARARFAGDGSVLAVVHLPDSVEDSLHAAGLLFEVVAEPGWIAGRKPLVSLRPFGAD